MRYFSWPAMLELKILALKGNKNATKFDLVEFHKRIQ